MAPKFLAADFLQAFLKLLPRGRVWSRDPDSVQNQALLGLNSIYEANSARASTLLTDVFPGSTLELLPEWESCLGLPDPCAGVAPTIQARRAQVVSRISGTGGQSSRYFTAVAANLGYQITISQFVPSRFGAVFGKRFGGTDWAHAWQANAPSFTINQNTFGGAFSAPFSWWNNNVLQCELAAIAPAHTILNFSYSE